SESSCPPSQPAARSPSPAWTLASDGHTSEVNSAPNSRPPCTKKAGSSQPRGRVASNSQEPATKPYTASASDSRQRPISQAPHRPTLSDHRVGRAAANEGS